jgi:predicted nucleotidyltransferase
VHDNRGEFGYILQGIQAISALGPRATWYGFGSYFSDSKTFSDIDILAVCASVEDAVFVRALASTLTEQWPLHLLLMSEHEAAETNFVITQQCIVLAIPLASTAYGLAI